MMNLSTAYLKKQQEWLMEGRRETAIAALREGLAPELVARITGLSISNSKFKRVRLTPAPE
jgi:hypothetical protein